MTIKHAPLWFLRLSNKVTTPSDILDEGLIPPMGEIGDLFASGELFVPEMLMAARAMKAGLAILRPILTKTQCQTEGYDGDGYRLWRPARHRQEPGLHDAGRGRVCKVTDLGVNTKAEAIIETAKEVPMPT